MAFQEINTDFLIMFSKFIKEKTGISFDANNWLSLKVSIRERMMALSIEQPDRYLSKVKEDLLERQELISLVVVPETYFYRDRRQFETLKGVVLPEIIRAKSLIQGGRPTIKIVSCGCSIGAEPYSMAIAILEAGLADKAYFEILAFDLSYQNIARAKEAIYSKYYFREPKTDLSKYFDVKGNSFILKSQVKNMVQFHNANLFDLSKADFSIKNADVVFLRNVLIYFDTKTILKTVEFIAENLSKDGYFFLGVAESLLRRNTSFNLQEIGETFVWRLKDVVLKKSEQMGMRPLLYEEGEDNSPKRFSTPPPELEIIVTPPLPKVHWETSQDQSNYENGIGYYKIKQFDKAEEELLNQLQRTPGHLPSLIALTKVYADSGKDQLAVERCRQVIEIDNLVADIYFILGFVAFKRQQYSEALKYFKKTVYCDENHFVAHYYCALTSKEMGDPQQANRQFYVAAHTIDALGEEGLAKELIGQSGSYILSLCMDNIS